MPPVAHGMSSGSGIMFSTCPSICVSVPAEALRDRLATDFASLSSLDIHITTDWQRGVVVSGVRRMNEVNARRARLVPEWVTVFGQVYHLGM